MKRRRCRRHAHRKYWVAGICLACLIRQPLREWSPEWKEFWQTIVVVLLVIATVAGLMMVS